MKRRIRKIANFFAFNLLFFALYLNFIHKDKTGVSTIDQTVQPRTAAFSGTELVENHDQVQPKKEVPVSPVEIQQPATVKTEKYEGTALRLSIN
jgi:hypothetical protein